MSLRTSLAATARDTVAEFREIVGIEGQEESEDRGEDDARFARRPAPSVGGLTAQEADAVLLRVTARWHRKIAVKAVGGYSDLPAAIQDDARKQGSDGSDIKAIYHWGTIYLLSERTRARKPILMCCGHDGRTA